MRLEQLAYFLEVSKHTSINLASEKLHISQQTLSGTIKSLEEELGLSLLERTHTGISLTPEGKGFALAAKDILNRMERFKDQYQSVKSNLKGDLQIYASPVLYTSILGDLVGQFCKKYPKIQVEVIENDVATIYQTFMEADSKHQNRIALVNTVMDASNQRNPFTPPEALNFYPILHETFVACVSRDSALARYKQISAKTLLKHPLVFYQNAQKEDNLLYFLLTQYGQPRISLSTGNVYLYFQSIANNVGIGFLPGLALSSPLLASSLEDLVVIPLKEDLGSLIGYLSPKEQSPSKIVEAFGAFLIDYIR